MEQEQHKTLIRVRDVKVNEVMAYLKLPQHKAEDTSLASEQSSSLAWNHFEQGWQQKSGEMWNPCPTLYPACSSSLQPHRKCVPFSGRTRGGQMGWHKWKYGPLLIGNSIKTSLPMHSKLGSKCKCRQISDDFILLQKSCNHCIRSAWYLIEIFQW